MKFGQGPKCDFCGAIAPKLCDGKMPNGKTCDKRICGAHTRTVALLRLVGPRRHDTRDLCPDCVAANRSVW